MIRHNNRPDIVELALLEAYNTQAAQIGHGVEMQKLATTDHGRNRWRHFVWLSDRLKSEILGMLYAYQERHDLNDMVSSGREAQESRIHLIKWLNGQPGDQEQHKRRAAADIDYIARVLFDALVAARDKCRRIKNRQKAGQLIKAGAFRIV